MCFRFNLRMRTRVRTRAQPQIVTYDETTVNTTLSVAWRRRNRPLPCRSQLVMSHVNNRYRRLQQSDSRLESFDQGNLGFLREYFVTPLWHASSSKQQQQHTWIHACTPLKPTIVQSKSIVGLNIKPLTCNEQSLWKMIIIAYMPVWLPVYGI